MSSGGRAWSIWRSSGGLGLEPKGSAVRPFSPAQPAAQAAPAADPPLGGAAPRVTAARAARPARYPGFPGRPPPTGRPPPLPPAPPPWPRTHDPCKSPPRAPPSFAPEAGAACTRQPPRHLLVLRQDSCPPTRHSSAPKWLHSHRAPTRVDRSLDLPSPCPPHRPRAACPPLGGPGSGPAAPAPPRVPTATCPPRHPVHSPCGPCPRTTCKRFWPFSLQALPPPRASDLRSPLSHGEQSACWTSSSYCSSWTSSWTSSW